MPAQGRLGDKGQVPADAHGCPACPHPAIGPAIQGSPNVNVNSRPALRVKDIGIHAACCGPNMWTAQQGSQTVFINGRAAHRMNDMQVHCGGTGRLVEGSGNVFVGDATSGGGGGGQAPTAAEPDPTSQHADNPEGQAPAASPADAAPADKKEPEKPKKVPISYKFEWDDGTPIKGYRTNAKASSAGDEEKFSSSDQHSLSGEYEEGENFHVEIHGSTKVQGVVKSCEGNPVVGAKVRIERAYGEAVETVTDGSGKFQADGFLGEEQHEVIITEPLRSIDGKVQDHEGNPVAGATVYVERAHHEPLQLTTDEGGNYHAEGFFEDEEHHATVSWKGKPAEVRLVDEQGKPIAGATVLAQPEGATTLSYTTDADGKMKIEGFTEDPWYRLAITYASGVAEGTFLDDQGEPKVGVRARVVRSSGPPIDVVSDGNGNYRAEGLVPGEDYVLEVVSYR
jgi:uncharacterized Zn-binding protein involved in type VI secretion